MRSYEITLTQFVDNSNYIHTLSLIYTCDPLEILISKTLENSPLHHQITSNLSAFPLTFIPRKLFDEVKGEELCLNSLKKVYEQDVEKKYVCMAALAGLISHIETSQNIFIYKGKLKINLIHLKDFLVIDFFSIKSLELILNSQGSRKDSLSSFFECKTSAGSRLLRACLLQPLKDKEKIKARQECVKELMNNSVSRIELKNCLAGFPNTELVTSRLLNKPKGMTEKFMKTQITNVINIFNTLKSAKILLNLLVKYDLKAEGTKILRDLIDDRRIDELFQDIQNLLSQDTLDLKTKTVSFFDCINCVKEGVNSLLDVNRQIYTNYLEELKKMENQFKYKLSEPSLEIIFGPVRGYHFQFNSGILKPNYHISIGEHFLQLTHKGKKSLATTASLMSLNEKVKNSQSSIISLNYSIIEELCSKSREHLLTLYNISHVVASLDLFLSFSAFSINHECIQPDFSSDLLKFKNIRSPLLLNSDKNFPFSLTFRPYKRFFMLTGKNSSGKTTLMKTLAQISILAHTGCFVPAETCTVSSLDYILTRIGERESIEQRSSSFMSEMKDSSYILNTVNRKTLVLVDELGKATSKEDGVAIAWSICERIYEVQAFCVFSTHFCELVKLEKIFIAVRNVFVRDWKVFKGACDEVSGYGVELALESALPDRVKRRAKEIFLMVAGERKVNEKDRGTWDMKKLVFRLLEKCRICGDFDGFRKEIFEIRREFFCKFM